MGIKGRVFFNFVFQPYLEADQTISGTIIGNEVTEQVIAKIQEESKNSFKQLLPQGHFMDQQCRNGRRAARLGFTQDKLMKNTKVTVGQMQYTLTILNPPLKHGMRQ
jgi:hypothetical protein